LNALYQEKVIMDPVTWFSIPAQDTDRATAFYSKVFGWKVQPPTKESDAIYNYNVVINSASDASFAPERTSRINGCIVRKATGITTPVVLVEVDDLDESARKVVAAGGTVVSERISMRSLNGDFILVKDPEGNMVEIFSSND
jgi:predicted enzyme related to lactoylglutathione lyase